MKSIPHTNSTVNSGPLKKFSKLEAAESTFITFTYEPAVFLAPLVLSEHDHDKGDRKRGARLVHFK